MIWINVEYCDYIPIFTILSWASINNQDIMTLFGDIRNQMIYHCLSKLIGSILTEMKMLPFLLRFHMRNIRQNHTLFENKIQGFYSLLRTRSKQNTYMTLLQLVLYYDSHLNEQPNFKMQLEVMLQVPKHWFFINSSNEMTLKWKISFKWLTS